LSDVVRLRATIVVEYDARLEDYTSDEFTVTDAVGAAHVDQLNYEQGGLLPEDFIGFDDEVVSVTVEPA
jgi:hypothetical protein